VVHVDTDALRRFANQFDTEVAAKLAASGTALRGAQAIEYSNFTTVHVPLAAVYVEAWNFHNRDLESKHQTAADFKAGLEATAEHWDEAERASTIRQDRTR
jgi:hypothetical protein